MGMMKVFDAPNTHPSAVVHCFENSRERYSAGMHATLTDVDRSSIYVTDTTLPSAETRHVTKLTVGRRLGGADGMRFELLERLGGGGMSVVFLARDAALDRKVAIKFLARDGLDMREALARTQQEARACARLSHQNIVQLFDIGTDRGTPFLVMEYLEGRTLDAILQRERLDGQRAVRILLDVCEALSQAHRKGVVHRDLKPGNIFVTDAGTVKILDFGVAAIADERHERGGFAGGMSGTPRYMSPEQWEGEPQDERTDIWAAGIMFFELLTGRPPFDAMSVATLREAVVSTPVPSLRDAHPELPEEVEEIAQRALHKEIDARYNTVDELVVALRALEDILARGMRPESGGASGPRTVHARSPSSIPFIGTRRDVHGRHPCVHGSH